MLNISNRIMSKPVDYCTVEFDFLTGGASSTFMSLTSAQRYAYICAWSYAVHLRKLHLSCYEMEHRLGAIYDIDSRTVAKMLQRCSEDDNLMIKENGGYIIVGVTIKHGKLERWKPSKKPTKTKLTGDRKGKDNIVKESTGSSSINHPPFLEISESWNELCKRSGLSAIQVWSKSRKDMVKLRWKFDWFADNWQDIFQEVHKNQWCRDNHIGIEHVLRCKKVDNALRYYEGMKKNRKPKDTGFSITIRYSDGQPPQTLNIKDEKQLTETINRMHLTPVEDVEREYYMDVEEFNRRLEG